MQYYEPHESNIKILLTCIKDEIFLCIKKLWPWRSLIYNNSFFNLWWQTDWCLYRVEKNKFLTVGLHFLDKILDNFLRACQYLCMLTDVLQQDYNSVNKVIYVFSELRCDLSGFCKNISLLNSNFAFFKASSLAFSRSWRYLLQTKKIITWEELKELARIYRCA